MRRNRFFTINDVCVDEQSFSGWWGQQIFLTDWLRFEGGLRGDVFVFDVQNRLPQQGVDPNFDPVFIDGHHRRCVSPKANLILTPLANTDVYLNFGHGFHSNDARASSSAATSRAPGPSPTGVSADAVVTPLAKAIGYELGVRTRQFDRLDVAAALWLLDLDSELVFSGDAGTVEPSPARRAGATASTSRRATRSPTGSSPTTT